MRQEPVAMAGGISQAEQPSNAAALSRFVPEPDPPPRRGAGGQAGVGGDCPPYRGRPAALGLDVFWARLLNWSEQAAASRLVGEQWILSLRERSFAAHLGCSLSSVSEAQRAGLKGEKLRPPREAGGSAGLLVRAVTRDLGGNLFFFPYD